MSFGLDMKKQSDDYAKIRAQAAQELQRKLKEQKEDEEAPPRMNLAELMQSISDHTRKIVERQKNEQPKNNDIYVPTTMAQQREKLLLLADLTEDFARIVRTNTQQTNSAWQSAETKQSETKVNELKNVSALQDASLRAIQQQAEALLNSDKYRALLLANTNSTFANIADGNKQQMQNLQQTNLHQSNIQYLNNICGYVLTMLEPTIGALGYFARLEAEIAEQEAKELEAHLQLEQEKRLALQQRTMRINLETLKKFLEELQRAQETNTYTWFKAFLTNQLTFPDLYTVLARIWPSKPTPSTSLRPVNEPAS